MAATALPAGRAAACSLPVALAIGLLAASLYAAAASVRIEGPGPYYDELHQATGAFTHLGSPPDMFSLVNIHGYPLLNMPYSAAIKTHLYGLYLRWSGRFTLRSWRLLGIGFVAVGMIAFCVLGRRALEWWALAVVLALLLTDGTLLLLGRHDFGPVDLAVLLRLLLLGWWLRGVASGAPTLLNSLGLGAIVGVAVLEKLSSVALVPALAVLVLLTRDRDRLKHLAAAAGGVVIGVLPLVAINVASQRIYGYVLSLNTVGSVVGRSPAGFWPHLYSVIGIGAGGRAASIVLGRVESAGGAAERVLLLSTLALALLAAWLRWPAARARWASACALAYVAVIVGFYFFPRSTNVHHWLIGTPFHYLAVALAWGSVRTDAEPGPTARRRLRVAVLAALPIVTVGWIATRVPTWARLERDLARVHTGPLFDPAFATLGRFAARHVDDAIFVASDWGVATQIYCFANGRPRFVHQIFWNRAGVDEIDAAQHASGTDTLYLVRPDPPVRVAPEVTERFERELADDSRWREAPVESEVARLGPIKVRKFVHQEHAAPGSSDGGL
jgi:hypothetical protein